MWCVVYAGEGREERAEDFIKSVLPASAYTRCFHLVKHKALKRPGILRDVAEDYLPGYVFIENDEPQAVHEILKKTPEKLLFSDDWFVSALAGEEEALSKRAVPRSMAENVTLLTEVKSFSFEERILEKILTG